jgi:hypothetical protein
MTKLGQKKAFVALAMILIRLALATRTAPLVFDDSAGYRWNGFTTIRPYGISALFSLCGQPEVIVVVQTLLSTACWLWLFASLHRMLAFHQIVTKDGWIAHLVVGAVMLVSLTSPIIMWDNTVLSESLTLGLMAATIAAALDLRVRRWDLRSQLVFLGVLVAGAMVREIALVTFMLPIAAASVLFHNPHRIRRIISLAAVGGFLSWVSFIPASQPYFQPGLTMTSFRNIVIIDCRVMQDPFLKRQLENFGMPRRPAPAPSKICHHPSDAEMTQYAERFPFGRYVLVEASRPTNFVRYIKAGIDRSTFTQLSAYGAPPDAPPLGIASWLLWSWSAEFHVAITAVIGTALLLRWWKGRRLDNRMSLGLAFTSLAVSALGAVCSFVAVLGSSVLEAGRHSAPFLIASRISLLVAGLLAVNLWAQRSTKRPLAAQHVGTSDSAHVDENQFV